MTSAHPFGYNEVAPACVNTRGLARTCGGGPDVPQCIYSSPVALVPLSSEAV